MTNVPEMDESEDDAVFVDGNGRAMEAESGARKKAGRPK
jgi:hypothetical protein